MSGMAVHFIIFHFPLVLLLKLFFKLLANSDLRDVKIIPTAVEIILTIYIY